jgi:hypothetical protein
MISRTGRKALKSLIQYNFTDELDDFFENPMDSGQERHHALAEVIVLADEFFPSWSRQIRIDIRKKAGHPNDQARAERLISYLDRVKRAKAR